MSNAPNRWLHLRHPSGFDDIQLDLFRAQCDVWAAYVTAVSRNWALLGCKDGRPPEYVFFPVERSLDRLVVTLPVGGYQTLGSRSRFEDGAAWMLSESFRQEFQMDLEEGLTEAISGPGTHWRPALRAPLVVFLKK